MIRPPLALAATLLALAGCGSTHRPDVVTISPDARRLPAVSLPPGLAPGAAVVADVTGAAAVRPRQLQFAADAQLAHLAWLAWGSPLATGRGTMSLDDCAPNCATGTHRSYPATIQLLGLRRCGGLRYYGTARVSADEPSGPLALRSFITAPCGA